MSFFEDIYNIEIDSINHIMDLIITPSFGATAYFQIHEVGNQLYELHWYLSIETSELIDIMKEFVVSKNLSTDVTLEDVLNNKDLVNYLDVKSKVIKKDSQ